MPFQKGICLKMSNVIPDHFKIAFEPAADPGAIVREANARFTVLTSRLIRMEYSPAGVFEDRPSQTFWYRRQPVPVFKATRQDGSITIETDHLRLTYTGSPAGFSPTTLQVTLKQTGHTWHYGDPDSENLGGTARTVDGINGHLPLEPGLLSRAGWAVVDDSFTLVFNSDCWLEPRQAPAGSHDLYFFGYGHAYADCLDEFTRVTGKFPLIPRWVLGNWWSRYWEYDEAELTGLMNDFAAHEIPLSVCIVDMDWHITKTGNRSTGWTGYTWNRALFPDPDRLIAFLHSKNLRTALNLHPADGVHPHEAAYPEMARRMGIDPASKEPVPFNLASPQFANAYFELLHHPEEARGVDFWWIDWQQGTSSLMKNLDPLWWLNHLHFLDQARTGKRPFIFSRWGGLGNHRYPIGFSGDSIVSWESLAFQPYFTATAANVAYGWWSHDIGGHWSGIEEPEMFLRWVQYGVFSPILRIHATKNVFQDRRPWRYDAETARLLREALQLRHAFVPYLYTLAWRNHTTQQPPIQPMYHFYPEQEEAYHCPQQYTFGPDLIAAPFTERLDPDTQLSRQVVWLPAGDWYNFFTGEHYRGDAWYALYGGLKDTPLFARAGAIIPLGPRSGQMGVENPDELDVHVFAGQDGRFVLYEDDGDSTAYQQGHYALTEYAVKWRPDTLTFTIAPATGDTTPIPAERRYRLHLHGIIEPEAVRVQIGEVEQVCVTTYDARTETLIVEANLDHQSGLRLEVSAGGALASRRDRTFESVIDMLWAFRLNSTVQELILKRLQELTDRPELLADYAVQMRPSQIRALLEVMFQAGVHRVEHTGLADRFVLWNNRGFEGIHYQFTLSYSITYTSEAGVLPRSKVIVPEQEFAHREWVNSPRWLLKADYCGLATILYEGLPSSNFKKSPQPPTAVNEFLAEGGGTD